MSYYPVFLNLNGKKCLVIGGGNVAFRKAARLVKKGAEVNVIAPEFCRELKELAIQSENIHLIRKTFESSDIENQAIVIGATDNHKLNETISHEARRKRVPVNIVDYPDLCDFILPAVVKTGDLEIGISTQGKAPFLAKRIREILEEHFTSEWERIVEMASNYRAQILAGRLSGAEKKKAYEKFAAMIEDTKVNSELLGDLERLLDSE